MDEDFTVEGIHVAGTLQRRQGHDAVLGVDHTIDVFDPGQACHEERADSSVGEPIGRRWVGCFDVGYHVFDFVGGTIECGRRRCTANSEYEEHECDGDRGSLRVAVVVAELAAGTLALIVESTRSAAIEPEGCDLATIEPEGTRTSRVALCRRWSEVSLARVAFAFVIIGQGEAVPSFDPADS